MPRSLTSILRRMYQQLSALVDAARYPDAEPGQVVHGRILAGRDEPAGLGPLSLAGPEVGNTSPRNRIAMIDITFKVSSD